MHRYYLLKFDYFKARLNLRKICLQLFILSVLVYSCQGIKKEYLDFVSKPILVDTNISKMPLMCIVYVDSLSCGPCRVKGLYEEWSGYIDFAKKTSGKFDFVFIMHPKKDDLDEVNLLAASLEDKFNLYIDKTGEFERLNPHLPKDSRFHTFLIDSTGKVLFVGSPINGEKLEELFFKTVNDEIQKK